MEAYSFKNCRTCGKLLPATAEYFQPVVWGSRDGLNHRCRPCETEYQASFRETNRERLREFNHQRYIETGSRTVRVRNDGTRQAALEKRISIFWTRVGKTDNTNDCWLWLAGKGTGGYGRFRICGKNVLAHRFSYEQLIGVIPEGLCVLHNCPDGDNPACVNPKHLWLGTSLDNIADRHRKGRDARCDRNASRLYPERLPRGERHSQAKLTEVDVILARRLYADGASVSKLMRRFHVSHPTMTKLVRGVTWKHVVDTGQSLGRVQFVGNGVG